MVSWSQNKRFLSKDLWHNTVRRRALFSFCGRPQWQLVFLSQGTTRLGSYVMCILSEPSGKLRVPEPTEFWGPPLAGKRQAWGPTPACCGFGLHPEPEAVMCWESTGKCQHQNLWRKGDLQFIFVWLPVIVLDNRTTGLTNQNQLGDEENILSYQLPDFRQPNTFCIFFTPWQGSLSLQNPQALFVLLVALRKKMKISQLL